jgi:hypothetical protein
MLFGYGCFPKRFRGTLNRFVKGGFWGVFRSSGGMTPEGPGTPLDGYSNKLYLYTVMRPYDVCVCGALLAPCYLIPPDLASSSLIPSILFPSCLFPSLLIPSALFPSLPWKD